MDYGAGNLLSVIRALRAVGLEAEIVSSPDRLSRHERIVLPGVGAFGEGIRRLRQDGLAEALQSRVAQGAKLLGICLGAQLLMQWSEEFGRHEGLGFVPGGVVAIARDGDMRVPHVGWAPVASKGDVEGTAVATVALGDWFYFCHSYACRPERSDDEVLGIEYGGRPLAAAIRHKNVLGLQFHPELSARGGIAVLARFAGTWRQGANR